MAIVIVGLVQTSLAFTFVSEENISAVLMSPIAINRVARIVAPYRSMHWERSHATAMTWLGRADDRGRC